MGLCNRYFYIYTRSGFRLLDVIFWPVMDLVVWGLIAKYFMRLNSDNPTAVSFLLGAIIFFNILNRAQQSISVSFLEDLWSRNLLNALLHQLQWQSLSPLLLSLA